MSASKFDGCVFEMEHQPWDGKAPFTGDIHSMITSHLTKPPPRVSEMTTGLPPAVDSVSDKAMAKEPAERYATTEDFVPAWKAVPVPDGVGMDVAAAVMVQGMTAHFLSHDAYAIAEGDTVLVHAVAGGVGLLLTQLAKKRGATVIGTCSSEEKAALAKAAGADHVVLYTETDFLHAVRELTDQRGVAAVYDSVGRSTFDRSLACLRPRGCLLLFGQSSGPVAPVDPQSLARQGSVYLTRPSLTHYMRDVRETRARAGALFSWLHDGELDVRIHGTMPLERAADAHALLESRRTSGKVLLQVA